MIPSYSTPSKKKRTNPIGIAHEPTIEIHATNHTRIFWIDESTEPSPRWRNGIPSPISRPSLSPDPPVFPSRARAAGERRVRPMLPAAAPRRDGIASSRRDASRRRANGRATRRHWCGSRCARRRDANLIRCVRARSKRGARPTRRTRPPSIPCAYPCLAQSGQAGPAR
jgi:hypothetical protein